MVHLFCCPVNINVTELQSFLCICGDKKLQITDFFAIQILCNAIEDIVTDSIAAFIRYRCDIFPCVLIHGNLNLRILERLVICRCDLQIMDGSRHTQIYQDIIILTLRICRLYRRRGVTIKQVSPGALQT